MPACYFYYCMSLLISSCWMGGQLATGASDKRYNWLRQSKDSFKKENKCVIFLTLSLEVISEERSHVRLVLLLEIRTRVVKVVPVRQC